jgi:phosphoglycerate dehydrogenase-like enzyme
MKLLVVDMLDRIERLKPPIDPILEPVYSELLPAAALAPRLAETEIILTTPRLPIDDELMDLAPHLRFVQVPSVGYERIDVEATRSRGIPCAHVPGHNALSVAEHVFMVTLALLRQLMVADRGIRAGQYAATKAQIMASGAYDLAGRTLGIVGFGRIGRQVARRAIGFELNTLYYDIVRPTPEEEQEYRVTFVEREELLRRADILTVHVPLEASTYHLIGEAELRLLKPTAIVVNAARGPLVDPAPLAQMVQDGLLAGAAVDVFETEPAPDSDPLVRLAMSGCDRVLLTPHLAGVTSESSTRGLYWALANVARFARGEPPLAVVNGVDVGAPAALAPQF